MAPALSISTAVLWLTALSSVLIDLAEANLRCYSCAPCNEFEFFAGDVHHFEADCYLDRYCMKISGSTTDIFGYRQEVAIRGCPWVSLLANFEEGCTQSAVAVAGAGLVEGTVCLCRDHLCNGGQPTTNFSSFAALLSSILSYFSVRKWNT